MKGLVLLAILIGGLCLAGAAHAQYYYPYSGQCNYNYNQGSGPIDFPVQSGGYYNGYNYCPQYPYQNGYQYPYQQYPNQYQYNYDTFVVQAGDPISDYVSRIDNDTYQIVGSNFGAYESNLDEVTVFGQTANVLYWSNSRITFTIPSNLSVGSYEVRLRKFERPYGYYPDKVAGRIEVGTNQNGQVLGASTQDDAVLRQQLQAIIVSLQQQVASLLAQLAARVH